MPRPLRRTSRRARPWLAAAAVFAAPVLAAPAAAHAQVGTTTDVLTGTIRDPAGKPIAGATVTVTSVETQVTRTRQTDARGRYVIVFPEGGGRYQLSARSIGLAPRTVLVQRQVDEDQLIANVTLGAPGASGVATLDRVVVRGQRGARGNDRPSPGSTERLLTPDQVLRLPIEDPSDLTALAALAPGVVSIAGTDSTANSFSVAGQRTDQNNVTLDGISFGASAIPQDAVRNTRVITSTYDVARGQFSGGQIASTTRSGTNLLQGSFTEQYRNPSLAWAPSGAGAFGQSYLQNSLSGGLGGPLIKNRLFFFGAFQLRERYDPIQSLTTANPATLQRLGVSPDSAARFLGGLSQYGVSPTIAGIPSRRTTDSDQLFARMDAVLSQSETLTLRLDGRRTTADATRIAALGLPSAGGTQSQSGGGVFAALTSQLTATDGLLAGAFINEVRAYRSLGKQDTDAYLDAPAGRVQVISALPATSTTAAGIGATVLQFGGNASLPQASNNTAFEGTEELSFIPAGRPHRIKLGALLNVSDLNQTTATNSLGTYTFSSLANFLGDEPSQFTRTLSPTQRLGGSLNAALYAGDTWRAGSGLQLTYGLRLEHSDYTHAPAANAGLDSAFGVRTGAFPTETHLSPRIGFTWAPTRATPNTSGDAANGAGNGAANGAAPDGGARGGGGGGGFGGRGGGGGGGGFGGNRNGGPTTVIRGGIGEFRGLAPAALFAAAQGAPGFLATQSQLVCTGAAVPTPDYGDWTSDPSAIPSSCVDVPVDGVPLGVAGAGARPNAVVIAPGFQAPRAWRASLGGQQRIGERTALSLDLNYALGV
ncbi:MAG TPA: carboxypeptidase regulatory-like domain-containing protein, partial [Gemmatirosa sp.]